MAQVHADDFESGELSGYGGDQTNWIATMDDKYEGQYCAKAYTSSNYSSGELNQNPGNYDQLFLRQYVKWLGRFENGAVCNYYQTIHIAGPGTEFMPYDSGTSQYTSRLQIVAYWVERAVSTSYVNIDTWYGLQCHTYWNDESTVLELKVDGTTWMTYNGTITASQVNYWRWFGGAWNYAPAGIELDAIVADDAQYPALLSTDDFYTVVLAKRENTLLRR